MGKKIIKLTENDLYNAIKQTVIKILNEDVNNSNNGMIHFDNTKTVKDNSKQNERFAMDLLVSGNETQLYRVGQTVDGNGFGFNVGTIDDVYSENGYIYYEIKYFIGKKPFTKVLRQKDIKIL